MGQERVSRGSPGTFRGSPGNFRENSGKALGWLLIERPKNINNFLRLSRKWVGVKFVCVLPFPGKKGAHKQNSQEISGKRRDNPGIVPLKICLSVLLFIGFSRLQLSSTVREVAGELSGSSGNFRGSPGTFQKLGGARLPPSDSPNLSPRPVPVLEESFGDLSGMV